MKILFKIATRNIFRRKRQSFIIATSIIASIAAMSFALSLSEGIKEQLILNMIRIETGAITVTPHKDLVTGVDTAQPEKMERFISEVKALPEFLEFRSRVHTSAHIYFNEISQRININGLNPADEKELFASLQFSYFNSDVFARGKNIIISQSISDKLGIKPDDICTLVTQTVQGGINMDEYRVAGIYKNISEWSNRIIYMPIEESSTLANAKYATHLLIDIKNLDKINDVKAKIRDASERIFTNPLKISSYDERTTKSSTIANANKYGFLFIVFFLQLISFLGISFAVINSAMEREKEIGTMLSIGFSPFKMRVLFAIETAGIALFSTVVGILLVWLVLLTSSINGFYLGDSAALAFGSSILKPIMTLDAVIICFMTGLIYPLIATYLSTRNLNKAKPINLLNEQSLYV